MAEVGEPQCEACTIPNSGAFADRLALKNLNGKGDR
jgi:hypothetical protein